MGGGLLPLIGAGLAVAVLVALSAWLGFRGQPVLEGPEEAALLARSVPGGFTAENILLTEDGRHALLADSAGRIAVVVPHGAHLFRAAFHEWLAIAHDVMPAPWRHKLSYLWREPGWSHDDSRETSDMGSLGPGPASICLTT